MELTQGGQYRLGAAGTLAPIQHLSTFWCRNLVVVLIEMKNTLEVKVANKEESHTILIRCFSIMTQLI
jgi:hypothetical protein